MFDLDGFSVSKQANAKSLRLIKTMIEIADKNYPEVSNV
jgi:hypothetical protein